MTQMPVFNRWDRVALGWYSVMPSRTLPLGKAKSMNVCGNRVVFFRGADSKVRALDAFCPHMGTDLGIGKVVGNEIRCFFHHWKFNDQGRCTDIPCQKEIPKKAKLEPYAVEEKYGFIWIYPEAKAPGPVPEFPEIQDQALRVSLGKPYHRTCHHHVTMINGIDPQHLRTVHGIQIDMDVDIENPTGLKNANVIDFTLRGEIPQTQWKARIAKFLLGASYEYKMRYDHASVGLLSILRGTRLFGGSLPIPSLYMLFAYTTVEKGKTLVQPVYFTPKRKGFFGWAFNHFQLWLTKRAFFALQGEDGQVYENMRFYPNALLPMDAPVGQFIAYVNRLKPSRWSANLAAPTEGADFFQTPPIFDPPPTPDLGPAN